MLDYLTNITGSHGEIIIAALSSVVFAFLIWSVKESYRRVNGVRVNGVSHYFYYNSG